MSKCELCGEPMPPGEEMFKYHGYSGPCPAPPLVKSSTQAHEALYQELTALMKKHAGEMSALEMLAVAANIVGKIVAMQDQRSVTPAQAMEVVSKNIEIGNAQVIAELKKSAGSA